MARDTHCLLEDRDNAKTKTKTDCLKDPTYATFLESRGFKDIKNHILTRQQVNFLLVNQIIPDQTKYKEKENFNLVDLFLVLVSFESTLGLLFSSDRSSCTDDGLLYIYPKQQPTFSDLEHLCLSILLQVSL